MKQKLISAASVLTALAASFCSSGSLILAALGLEASGLTFWDSLSKYKSFFIFLTGILFSLGYRLSKSGKTSNSGKLTYWISVVLAIIMLCIPIILRLL